MFTVLWLPYSISLPTAVHFATSWTISRISFRMQVCINHGIGESECSGYWDWPQTTHGNFLQNYYNDYNQISVIYAYHLSNSNFVASILRIITTCEQGSDGFHFCSVFSNQQWSTEQYNQYRFKHGVVNVDGMSDSTCITFAPILRSFNRAKILLTYLLFLGPVTIFVKALYNLQKFIT
jgi:hypothetical protein